MTQQATEQQWQGTYQGIALQDLLGNDPSQTANRKTLPDSFQHQDGSQQGSQGIDKRQQNKATAASMNENNNWMNRATFIPLNAPTPEIHDKIAKAKANANTIMEAAREIPKKRKGEQQWPATAKTAKTASNQSLSA